MENQTIWRNDKKHSRLGFVITHMIIGDIKGLFNNFDLTIVTSKSDFSDASFELSAEINSVFTNYEGRDEDLRGPNFFNARKYPTLNFKSNTIEESSTNNYKVTGNLSMRGFTKEVTVDIIYKGTILSPNSNKITSGFQVLAALKRSDFKIGFILPFDGLKDDILIKMDGEFAKE